MDKLIVDIQRENDRSLTLRNQKLRFLVETPAPRVYHSISGIIRRTFQPKAKMNRKNCAITRP